MQLDPRVHGGVNQTVSSKTYEIRDAEQGQDWPAPTSAPDPTQTFFKTKTFRRLRLHLRSKGTGSGSSGSDVQILV